MIDNKFFFDKSVELGFTTRDYESLVNLHTNGARTLQIMGCKSVFEFGSGLGFFLSACQRIGLYNYVGYDINPYERDFAISKGIEPSKYTLAKDKFKLSGKYDAIYSTEVFEHMTDAELNKVMPILYKACNKYFYFTSTPFTSTIPEWDIEWGHINIKQKDEWIALFKKHGFDYLQDATDVCSWGLLFKKNENIEIQDYYRQWNGLTNGKIVSPPLTFYKHERMIEENDFLDNIDYYSKLTYE